MNTNQLPVIQPGEGLAGIERPLDNTALSAYAACPREYYFGMVLHRRAGGEGGALSPALAYGTAWHLALETHYKSGGNAALVEMLVRSKWQGHESPDDYRTLDRVLLDYKRYCDRYGQDPTKEDGQTVGYPHQPAVELSTNAMGGGLIHPYAVKIDRIITLGGLAYVEDHKTTSRLDSNFYRGFDLSQQMMGYVFVAQQLMPSLQIAGVRINVCHVLKSGTNFERQLFTYTPEKIQEWVANTNQWMERIAQDSRKWKAEEEVLGEFGRSTPRSWPLGHYGDNGCSRKYGMCQYHRACSISPRLREQVLESEYPVNPWNPLHADD